MIDVNIVPFQSDFNMGLIVVTELTKAIQICALVIVWAATTDYTSVTYITIFEADSTCCLIFYFSKKEKRKTRDTFEILKGLQSFISVFFQVSQD